MVETLLVVDPVIDWAVLIGTSAWSSSDVPVDEAPEESRTPITVSCRPPIATVCPTGSPTGASGAAGVRVGVAAGPRGAGDPAGATRAGVGPRGPVCDGRGVLERQRRGRPEP